MVVCNTTVVPIHQASCPVTPATLHYCAPGVCPLNNGTCQQRFQTATIFPGNQMITASGPLSCTQGLSTSQILQCTQSLNTSNPVNCVSTTSTVISCNQPMPSNPQPVCNPNLPQPATNAVNCNTVVQGIPGSSGQSTSPIINQALTTTPILPCTQKVITAIPCNSATAVCPVPPPQILPPPNVSICPVMPSSPTMCPVTSPLCSVVTLPAWKQSYGMEQVWQCEFRTLFCQYAPHAWVLLPVNQKPAGVWISNVDSAKVRFCCEDCGHGWTSMKGRVAFWFLLNPASGEGIVCLKLYGQQCDRCKSGNYEPAMWYPEEVIKVLVNIYNKVGQAYYGFQQAPFHRARRPGKPRTPHNSELCQACKDGVCAERR